MTIEYKMELLGMAMQLILIPLFTWGLTIVKGYMEEKSAWTKLIDAIETATGETTQVFVNKMKEQGTFDKDAVREAIVMSRDTALSILTPKTKEILEGSVGDLNEFILARIEAEVLKQKKAKEEVIVLERECE